MNFNSLIIGPSSAKTTTLLRGQVHLHLGAGQRVVYIGGRSDWQWLKEIPSPAGNAIIFIHTPQPMHVRAAVSGLHRLVGEIRNQAGLGVAVYLNPPIPGLSSLLHEWLDAFGVTVHLVLTDVSALSWLDLSERMELFQFRRVFLCGQETAVGEAGPRLSISSRARRQMSGPPGQLAAVRFDDMGHLVDVAQPAMGHINRQLPQLRAAAPVVMPGLPPLKKIPVGFYPIVRLWGAVDRVYVETQGRLRAHLFLCYDLEDAHVHRLARIWKTFCVTAADFHFVALPDALSWRPFNQLGRILDPGHCLWRRNVFLREEPAWEAVL